MTSSRDAALDAGAEHITSEEEQSVPSIIVAATLRETGLARRPLRTEVIDELRELPDLDVGAWRERVGRVRTPRLRDVALLDSVDVVEGEDRH